MSFTGTYGLFSGPGATDRFRTKSRIEGGLQAGMRYPHPFFDLAHTYMPATVKSLFNMCMYYFVTNGTINTTVTRLAEYPITDLIIEHEVPQVQKLWNEYLHDHLEILKFHVESGLDYYALGNSICSVSYPLVKYLKCPGCGYSERADKIQNHWRISDHTFRLECPECKFVGEAQVSDYYLTNPNGIRLLRWNAADIDIQEVEVTGKRVYYYTPPNSLKSNVILGKKDIAANIPQQYLDAMKRKKSITFAEGSVFHLQRAAIASTDRGWGQPLLLPLLKDAFHLQIMKKSQEALLLEHCVPLRVLFPQPGSAASDPMSSINLGVWQEAVAREITRWRLDANHIPLLPLPIGQESIGGDAKALLMTPEIQALQESLVVSAGVPREFVFGGTSYAGTSVSMRQVENMFMRYMSRRLQMTRWFIREIAAFLNWPIPRVRFKPLKSADDIQRKQFMLQANSMGKISDTTLVSELDLDQRKENELMIEETVWREKATKAQQLAMARIQGEVQLVSSKYMVRAQQEQAQAAQAPAAPGEPGGPENGMQPSVQQQFSSSPLQAGRPAGPSLIDVARLQAQSIANLPPPEQQRALQVLRAQSPELAQLVQQMLGQMGGAQQPQPAQIQGAQPLPNVLPPRREASPI